MTSARVEIALRDIEHRDGELRVSSRVLAQRFGKRHAHVLRDIETLEISELFRRRNVGLSQYEQPLPTGGTKLVPERRLTRDGAVMLVMGWRGAESIAWKEAYIAAFNEMERRLAEQQPDVPRTYAAALRLAAEQAELIEAQQTQLAEQAPAVELVEKFVRAKSSSSLRDTAKILGFRPQAFISRLVTDGVLFRRVDKTLLPYAHHLDAGRFEVKMVILGDKYREQTRVTPVGIGWLAKHLGRLQPSSEGEVL